MSKVKYLFALSAMLALPLFGQFMDPERPIRRDTTTKKSDDIFPWIVPDHGGGSKDVKELTKTVTVLSNDVKMVQVKLETKLDNNAEAMTNSTEFVTAVTKIVPGVEDVTKIKEENTKFHAAFTKISNITISDNISIDEIKANLLIIKAAAQAVLAE